MSIDRTADWWLGNLDGPWFKALNAAVHDEWNVEPLLIREGGVSDMCGSGSLLLTVYEVHPIDSLPREGIRLPSTSPSTRTKHCAFNLDCFLLLEVDYQ